MTEIPSQLLLNFLIFLSFPFVFALIAKKLKVSPIVGYMVSGLVLGNMLGGLYSHQIINNFAYFGIILLLFTVGLEINITQILNLKKFIVIGGIFQLLFSIFFIFVVSLLFKFNLLTSLLVGIALSSSSTTIVAKIIQDRGEEASFIGELAIGILMFQDIAFIPFLIIFTSITSNNLSFGQISINIFLGLLKSFIIISILYFLGQKIITHVFNRVAKASRELLNFFIIVFIFSVTYLSTLFQIPILIGVFVAGILVGQTIEHHHIFSQVRPLRDILAVIFFVFIGLNINIGFVLPQLPKLFLFFGFVAIIKWMIIFIIFLFLRFHSRTSFALATYLFQIDEDAFILMSQALVAEVVGQSDYSFVISNVMLTLILTPIVIKNKDKIYNWVRKITKKYLPFFENFIRFQIDRDISPIDSLDIRDHVVICGYGRVGRYIGRALMLSDIPFIAIDYDYYTVEKAKKEGVNIVYGDPTDIDILDYAQVDDAQVLISVVPERFSQETIILNAKKLNPKIVIFNRVHQEGEQRRMKDLGVEVVVHPEFEASLSIIRRILHWKGVDKEEIARKVKRLKIEHGMI